MILKEANLFLINLKVNQLKKKCKDLDIKGYSKLKKNDLVDSIINNCSSCIIQRWFRSLMSYNDLCMITLERIKYPCWPLRVPKGWMHYNLPDLVDYFLVSGDFREPQTKRKITEKELKSLDDYTKKLGMKKKSLCVANKNKDFYRKQKIREEHVDTLVEQIRDVVCIIRERLSTFEDEDSSMDISIQLDVIYYPTLNAYMRSLYRSSKRYLKICIANCIQILEETKIIYSDSKQNLKLNVINWLDKQNNKY